MSKLFGMPVVTSPLVEPVPVLQLSPSFKWCSEEFRAKLNAELLEMFGTKEVVYIIDMDALGMHGGQTILMNPKCLARMWL